MFIDKVPNISVNLNYLSFEYKTIKDRFTDVTNHGNKVLVQRKFQLMIKNEFTDKTENLIYTRKIHDQLKSLLDYNSITYRFVLPNTCYNWHMDTGQTCLHIPIKTNPGCWFVYENRCFHMPADGSVYKVDNSRLHTFINAGSEPRLHLTFEIL